MGDREAVVRSGAPRYCWRMSEPRPNRRLAAVMAADVVGYSRMMAQDESRALAALNAHRATGFDPIIAEYGGQVIKLMGDGALVEFRSVVDAVAAALTIQQAAGAAGGAISLRIGVNLGDVIVQDGDIFGDGVNVAARLEQLAAPGGVCVSAAVAEIVAGRVDAVFADGGVVSVKNIDRSLHVFHWSPGEGATGPPSQARAQTPRRRGPSIAVLPFDNMSGDAEQEYFSDGISEDIITDLSKIAGLTVIARNSSFVYKGRAVDLRDVGRDLGVTTVLEGSVRRAGGRVRITAQLIDASTGAHLWADRFDRELTDLFAVQDEVALRIVEALRIKLTPEEKSGITETGAASVEAHEEFMRMRSRLFLPGLTAQQWRDAIAAGERAVAIDPGYADAYGMLGIMHVLDFHNQWSGRSPEAVMAHARSLADHACALAPEGVLSNHAAAVVGFWSGDLRRAEETIGRVLAARPEYALALFTRGEVAMGQSSFDAAIPDFERAIRLDPEGRQQYLQFLAMAHFLSGHLETALLMFRERVALAPGTDIGRAWLAATLGHLGEAEEARRVWTALKEINPSFDAAARFGRLPFADTSAVAAVVEGLTKAGLQVGP